MSVFLDDDVVISGLSGVFPKCDNVEKLAEKLFAKENLLSDAPNMPVKLGKLNDLSKFDAEFFGFNQPHRVEVMEPMSRIIMEKVYEALIDSGNNPVTLKGKSCGVYIGVHSVETEMLTYHKIQKGAYLAMSRSFFANRISFWLGIHGPSYTVDSACSSTLVALENASKAIRAGACDSAIVGGCQICLHPAVLHHLLAVGALNPKGESRVFDENAGGFCKGECIGVFYLERYKNAKRVYARVIDAQINHDGEKPLFLSPWGPSQTLLLKQIYNETKIEVNSVAWIETHATGTQVGDKQEVNALDNVFANRDAPLLISSVKSNMGHAEAAAGVASLSKIIIAMETGFIPPNINITTLRKDLEAFKSGRIKVVTEKTPWNGGIVGVSGFGLGGVNCHVVVESFKKEKINHGIPNDDLPRIVGVSGRTVEAVDVLLHHLEMTSLDSEFVGLLHEIHKYDISSHQYRGIILLHKNKHCIFKKNEKNDRNSRKTLFVFTNFLSKWCNIYRSLNEINIFQQSIIRSNAIFLKFGINLIDFMDDSSKNNALLFHYLSSFVIQIALYDLMCDLNVTPDYIIGCSLGELICAYADGCLNIDETISAGFHCAAFLASQPKNIEGNVTVLANINHSALAELLSTGFNFTLSYPSILTGPKNEIVKFLQTHHITFCNVEKPFKIPTALHTEELLSSLRQIIKSKSKSEKWINWSESQTDRMDAEYFIKCITQIGNTENFFDHFPADVIVVSFLSTTFHNVPQNALKGDSVSLSLTNEDETVNVDDFLSTIGELYLLGKSLNFSRLYPPVTYPVSRGTKMIAPLIRWKHTTSWPVAFTYLEESLLSSERCVSISVADKQHCYLAGHEIDSSILYPGTGYLVLVWETLALIRGKIHTNMPVVFENVQFLKLVTLDHKDPVLFEIMVHKGTGLFEIMEKGHSVVTGRIYSPQNIQREKFVTSKPAENYPTLNQMDFYRYILIRGHNYRGLFRSILQINCEGTKARINWAQNWVTFLDGLLQISILHDKRDALYVPVEIEKIIIDTNMHNEMIKSSTAEFDVIFDEVTNVIECGSVQVKGFNLRSILPKPIKNDPLLQKYFFLPFNNNLQKVSITETIYLFCHVIMDNLGQDKPSVEIVEILDENVPLKYPFISSIISKFVKEQPLFRPDLKIYSSSSTFVDKTDVDISITRGNLPLNKFANVIICSNAWAEEQKLRQAVNSLHDDGFLICCEKSNAVATKMPSNLFLCSNLVCNGLRFLLFKKKLNVQKTFEIIKISCDEYSWIEELQKALKANIADRIILFAEEEFYCGILGFYHSLRMERNSEHIRCFLILNKCEKFSLDNTFFKDQVDKDLAVNVYKDGEWGCYVRQPLEPLPLVDVHHAFVKLNNSKEKVSLQWTAGSLQPSSETVFHVYYASINLTDVLLFKRRISTETIMDEPLEKDHVLGIEFSGRSKCGKRYMGLKNYGCLSSYIELKSNDVFYNEVPNNWSLEDAVTVPLAYYTIIYAFMVSNQLKSSESILIHSPGNPYGQAAINLAIHIGCKIFVTVSSVDEKLFVEEHFSFISSSNIIKMSNSLHAIVNEKTGGKGVDVILGSLPFDQLRTNIDLLAQNGRYINLKPMEVRNNNLNANKLLTNNISFRSALLNDIFKLPYDKKVELKETVDKYVKNSAIKPLLRKVYHYSAVESAFAFASLPHNFGKCVIQIEREEDKLNVAPQTRSRKAYRRFICDSEKCFVVCGGLGGMGMELVNWLISRGAKKIVIGSRKNEAVGSQILRMKRWRSYGANVVIVQADISDETQTASLLDAAVAMGPVGGIFNLAGILKDKIFKNHAVENFTICAGPKFRGTMNLDKLSRVRCPNLEYFVVFSSVASGFGSLGQTNYALFNSAVERICERRRQENLPGLAVEWGAVGNVGMLVSHLDGNVDESFAGYRMQPIKSCMDALDQFLCQTNAIVSSCIISN